MTPDQEEISQNKADTTEEKNKSTGHESTRYQSSTKRIAKNTLMLYFRQILIMLVSLYTVRVVLNTLGAEDYGIYNVVAGVVTMFSFLSGAMATASQRYFAFEMGRGNEEGLQKIFSVTMTIYMLLALIIMLLAETVGLWFVNTRLVIPAQRMTAARWIYQFAILSFMVTLLTTPYMASIIAHENMNVYAYVSIAEAVLKLGIVFMLRVLPYDKLIVYGALLLIVACINTGLYRGYCKRRYAECRFRLLWDMALCSEMISFIGWNFFGSFSSMIKNQGNTLLLNWYIGPIANAAQGIANQIRNAVSTFSQNFNLAVRPQITKEYAQENYENLFNFLSLSCKLTFFLMLVIIVPVYYDIEFILQIWLKNVPEYTIPFVRLLLIEALIESISLAMASANQATGKISVYQRIIGFCVLLNLPISFFVLVSGNPPQYIYAGGIVCMCLLVVVRVVFLKQIPQFQLWPFVKNVFFPSFIAASVSFVLASVATIQAVSIFLCFADLFIKAVIVVCVIYILGLRKNERRVLREFVRRR